MADWQAEIAADVRPKVIIDDHPTGTQAVSDVDVILRPDRAAFDDLFASGRRAAFVLSNSRALPERAAAEPVGGIARTAMAAARAAGRSATLILPGWVREVSGGRRHARTVPLDRLRRQGPDAVADALVEAGPDTVVVPYCASRDDVLAIAAGLLRAERRGASVVVRCAASPAAALAGLTTRPLDRIEVPPPGRVLVACGSFTAASTRQLRALDGRWERRVEIPVAPRQGDDRRPAEEVRERLTADGRALPATDRTPGHGRVPAAPELLMDALVATVRRLAPEVDLVVAKGGITSARPATDALQATSARVRGQIRPGVPVWSLRTPLGGPSSAVVPGDVGADDTLRDILGRVGPGR